MTALERHHVFGGSRRGLSEEYGLVVGLCHWCHNEPPNGVHFNPERMDQLHEWGEIKYLHDTGETIDGFRQRFGKNYLSDKTIALLGLEGNQDAK